MLKKSNRISLEEATRLAILGKLPLKENKTVKTESTTVTTTDDNLTVVDTDDANIVIEPKGNAAVDVGAPIEAPLDEPMEEMPIETSDEEMPIEDMDEDIPLDENKKITEGEAPLFKKVISKHDIKKVENKEVKTEGEAPLFKKKINKTDIKKVENKNKGLKEHKVAFKASNKLQEGVYAVEYISSFYDLYDSSWGQAVRILDEIKEAGKDEELMDYLEAYGDSADTAIDRTELNDLLAFEWEQVYEDIGMPNEDEDLDESKKVEGKKIEEGEAPLFKKKINKTDIKKVESKEVKEEGCGKKKEDKKEEGCGEKKEEAPKKRNVINKVDLRKTESKKEPNLNEKLKTKVAEGLTNFVKEAYTNGKEVKVEKVLNLTENKLYVKGSLVMENSTRDFNCKLIPVKENKSFRKYTIKENKLLKITEGKTSKGKSFNLVIKK